MKHLNSPEGYRPDIDGLRAIAILGVISFHLLPGIFPGAFSGVDVFFVISGYLISRNMMEQESQGQFFLWSFYQKRICRIFPALLVILVAGLLLGALGLFPDEFVHFSKHVRASSLFLENLQLWSEVGYFDLSSKLKPLLHLWSLSVEEQFYLFWPFFLPWAWRRGSLFLFSGLLFLFAFSLGLHAYFQITDPSFSFFMPFTRFWEFAAGTFAALIYRENRFGDFSFGFSILGFFSILSGFIFLRGESALLSWQLSLPVVGAFFMILAGPQGVFNRFLGLKPIRIIGLFSYSLYLWHWLLISFTEVLDGPGIGLGPKIKALLIIDKRININAL